MLLCVIGVVPARVYIGTPRVTLRRAWYAISGVEEARVSTRGGVAAGESGAHRLDWYTKEVVHGLPCRTMLY